MTAKPRIQQPIFLLEVRVSQEKTSGIYVTLAKNGGKILEEDIIDGTDYTMIRALLPVSKSFGFTEKLRLATGGKAFPQFKFDHWETILDDPFLEGSESFQIVRATRIRKGMKPECWPLEHFLDKL